MARLSVCGISLNKVWSVVHFVLLLWAALVIELVSRFECKQVFPVHVAYVTTCLALEVKKLCLLYKGWKHPFKHFEGFFYLYGTYHIIHGSMIHLSYNMWISHVVMCAIAHIYHLLLIYLIFKDIGFWSYRYLFMLFVLGCMELITNFAYDQEWFADASRLTVLVCSFANIQQLSKRAESPSESTVSKSHTATRTSIHQANATFNQTTHPTGHVIHEPLTSQQGCTSPSSHPIQSTTHAEINKTAHGVTSMSKKKNTSRQPSLSHTNNTQLKSVSQQLSPLHPPIPRHQPSTQHAHETTAPECVKAASHESYTDLSQVNPTSTTSGGVAVKGPGRPARVSAAANQYMVHLTHHTTAPSSSSLSSSPSSPFMMDPEQSPSTQILHISMHPITTQSHTPQSHHPHINPVVAHTALSSTHPPPSTTITSLNNQIATRTSNNVILQPIHNHPHPSSTLPAMSSSSEFDTNAHPPHQHQPSHQPTSYYSPHDECDDLHLQHRNHEHLALDPSILTTESVQQPVQATSELIASASKSHGKSKSISKSVTEEDTLPNVPNENINVENVTQGTHQSVHPTTTTTIDSSSGHTVGPLSLPLHVSPDDSSLSTIAHPPPPPPLLTHTHIHLPVWTSPESPQHHSQVIEPSHTHTHVPTLQEINAIQQENQVIQVSRH